MKWTKVAVPAALALLGLSHLTCNQAIMTAPAGTTLTMNANPGFIPANGGSSVISALLIEPAGTPVADGTVVQFFTDLGTIPEQGKTNDGVVRVNLVSDSRSGVATVTATSGGGSITPSPSPSATPTPSTGSASISAAASAIAQAGEASASVKVCIGNVNAASITGYADPPRITNSRSTHVFALVFDQFGNPLRGVPVFFRVTDNPATEFMDSAGRPIFSDNNGLATDVMRTRATTSHVARVHAQVAGASAEGCGGDSGGASTDIDVPIVIGSDVPPAPTTTTTTTTTTVPFAPPGAAHGQGIGPADVRLPRLEDR
jgi:hypothetical protein